MDAAFCERHPVRWLLGSLTTNGRGMKMTNAALMQQMIKIAVSHGFDAHQDDNPGQIVVWVPWVNPTTGEDGEDQFICRNISDLRVALGY